MSKRWISLPQPEPEKVQELSAVLHINNAVSRLLLQRGIDSYEKAKLFFRPSMDHLHDPFLMKDMGKAVDRLSIAIAERERIMIYGDYDVDGTTSVALLYDYIGKHTENIDFYINDRESEGYGISETGIQHAIQTGAKLIISIDCGIKAGNMVELAEQNNIDFIICDHHTPGEEVPCALAVLDPKQKDCNYPYKELSGCGIGYKLLSAWEIKNQTNHGLENYLDLVAVSIAADIVPLTGENRVLCYYGISKLTSSPRPGLQALIDISSYPVKTVSDVVFGVAPRINAAGRIDHAHQAVDLLLCKDPELARDLAMGINGHNEQRREFDALTTEEALAQIESDFPDQKSTVVYKEDWHKGVIGIVASRLIEKYYRPTIVLTRSNGSATGSARSVSGFDIYEAISGCEDLLDKFGGHKFAAGLTLPLKNIPLFRERFEEVVSRQITEEQQQPSIEINTEISFDLISMKLLGLLEQMEPFGPENPKPVFVAHNVFIRGGLRLLKETHVKFTAGQEGTPCFDAIGFGLGAHYKDLCRQPTFSMAFTVELNDFRGNQNIQLRLIDLKITDYGA